MARFGLRPAVQHPVLGSPGYQHQVGCPVSRPLAILLALVSVNLILYAVKEGILSG